MNSISTILGMIRTEAVESHQQGQRLEKTEFERDLETLINRTSQESPSNTPDFILAQYLVGCLAAFNTAVQQRETWYGRDASPGAVTIVDAGPPHAERTP